MVVAVGWKFAYSTGTGHIFVWWKIISFKQILTITMVENCIRIFNIQDMSPPASAWTLCLKYDITRLTNQSKDSYFTYESRLKRTLNDAMQLYRTFAPITIAKLRYTDTNFHLIGSIRICIETPTWCTTASTNFFLQRALSGSTSTIPMASDLPNAHEASRLDAIFSTSPILLPNHFFFFTVHQQLASTPHNCKKIASHKTPQQEQTSCE